MLDGGWEGILEDRFGDEVVGVRERLQHVRVGDEMVIGGLELGLLGKPLPH